jgi:hypothetical protein
MEPGSTEFLLSLFDDADNGLKRGNGRAGAGSSSSSRRPAPLLPPKHLGASRSAKGRMPASYMLDDFDDPLEDPFDFMDDEQGLDDDEFFDDDFSDEFMDDGMGLSPLTHQSPFILVHRRNPFGRLNLPPIRRLRPGFHDVDSALAASALMGGGVASMEAAASSSSGKERLAGGMASTQAASSSSGKERLDVAKSPKRNTLEEPKSRISEKSRDNLGARETHEHGRSSAQQSFEKSVDPHVQAEPSTLTSKTSAEGPGSSVNGMNPQTTSANNAARPKESKAEGQPDIAPPVKKIGEQKARQLCDLDGIDVLMEESAPPPAKLAFQWFCEDCPDGLKLADCVSRWKEISEEERNKFKEMADTDTARFQKEYEEWQRGRFQQGLECSDVHVVLEGRSKRLERKMDEAELRPRRLRASQDRKDGSVPTAQKKVSKRGERDSYPKKAMKRSLEEAVTSQSEKRSSKVPTGEGDEPLPKKGRQQREKKPDGYPKKAMTAYGIFCQKRKLSLSEASALRAAPDTTRDTPETNEDGATLGSQKESSADDGANLAFEKEPSGSDGKRGTNPLQEYRAAWSALSVEEREAYASLAAQDEHRFRGELESWLSRQEDGGLGTEVTKVLLQTGKKKKLVTKAIPPESKRKVSVEAVDINSMASVLLGAAALKRPRDAEPSASSSSLPALADPGSASSQGYRENIIPSSGLPAQADESDGEDLFAGFGTTQEQEPWDTNESSSPMLPLPTSEGLNSVDPLPTPSGVPAAFGPAIPENDRVAKENDWTFAEDDDEVGFANAFALEPLQKHEDIWDDFMVRDTGAGGGGGGGGALQLQFDAEGRTIIDPSSTQVVMDDEPAPVDVGGDVSDAVKHYESAYPRTKATKWNDEETDRFYEALSIYGTDLFLVQTFFRDKSAAQIKTKYNKEMKKHPQEMQRALTTQARRLTKDAFEKQHGKIDTSKHYVPPATPEPGDEPEPEIDNTTGLPDQMFPPEPECTEEDEADTTNRLMALFD